MDTSRSLRASAPGLLAAALVMALLPLHGVAAHGFMAEPKSRSYLRNWQSCPHCVNAGGTWPSSGNGKLAWPQTAAPVCGARELMQAGSPVESYVSGGDIEITIFISAQHGGRHQFRLCPRSDVSDSCLDDHVLRRADGKGAYSWTPLNGGDVPGAKWRKDIVAGLGGESYTWRYSLPEGVTCEHCVLQWQWTTANSCRVPGSPSYVGSDSGMLSCTDKYTYPEQFFGCTDISIKGGKGSSGGGRTSASSHRNRDHKGERDEKHDKEQGDERSPSRRSHSVSRKPRGDGGASQNRGGSNKPSGGGRKGGKAWCRGARRFTKPCRGELQRLRRIQARLAAKKAAAARRSSRGRKKGAGRRGLAQLADGAN